MGEKSAIFECASLDIVIVNWNSGKQLYDCLKSLQDVLKGEKLVFKVIVVDNGSTDQSLTGCEGLELPLLIITNESNLGFAAASNQGAQYGTAENLLFLNPDTVVKADSILKPLLFMSDNLHNQVGILGVQLVSANNIVQKTCARFPKVWHFWARIFGLNKLLPGKITDYIMVDWDHLESRMVDHVMGSYFWVRRKLFEDLCGFDERYFVYLEDLDFSLIAKNAGWHSYYYAEVSIFHRGGGTSEQVKGKRLFYSLQSRMIYSFKHFGVFSALSIFAGTMTIEFFVRLVGTLINFRSNSFLGTIEAYLLLWKQLPVLIKKYPQQ